MSKILVQFANLTKPLFLNRRNFGEKLNTTIDVMLEYDMNRKELYVGYNGRVAVIPSSNIASFEPVNPADIGYNGKGFVPVKTHTPQPMVADIGSAQVSTPHGYVFEGPGKGKTNSK